MFVALLKFSANRAAASEYMAAHNSWLQEGFDAGVFYLAGSLQPGQGGAIIADNCSRDALEARLAADPFVQQDVVVAEILEISPAKAAAGFESLLGS